LPEIAAAFQNLPLRGKEDDLNLHQRGESVEQPAYLVAQQQFQRNGFFHPAPPFLIEPIA